MKNESGFFKRYAGTISWALPIATSLVGTSLIAVSVNNPILIVSIGLLMLLTYLASIFFGVLGFIQYKKYKSISVLVQSIIGTLFGLLLIAVFLLSAISSYLHHAS